MTERKTREVSPRDRVEVFADIIEQFDVVLAPYDIKNPFRVHIEDQIGLLTIPIPNSDYQIIKDLKIDSLDVTVAKVKIDELAGESREEIRVKVGRAGVSLREPNFEYHRNVRNQRRRNLRPNTIGTVAATEKFLREMELSLRPVLQGKIGDFSY